MAGTETDSQDVFFQQFQLNDEQQHYLLRLARQAIAHFLETGEILQPPATNDSQFRQKAGVFVTLRTRRGAGQPDDKAMRLRGCIGHVEADVALLDLVPVMAVKAATEDPRFPPVTAVELPNLHIEISLLSPLEPVTDVASIEIGVHGLVIISGLRRGLLLPQVPLMFDWSREDYLAGICRKAGLPDDAWRYADLLTFTTQVFEEAE
jgi:AmmeMemoRadiSam system protein A